MKYNTKQYGSITFHHSLSEHPDAKQFERHCHNGYELIYVTQGQGKYVVESTDYPLCPNTVLLLRPYEYHYVCPDHHCTYERYVVHFSEKLVLDAVASLPFLISDHTENGVYFSNEAVTEHIRAQFTTLGLDCFFQNISSDTEKALYETVLLTAVNQILILLSHVKSETPTREKNEWIDDVMRYLNENLNCDISLEDTARRFYVNKYHLCHAFLKHTGISVFSYLNAKRIALAEQLLENGIPAADVAERVGFHDYSVFYRAYRKVTGKSPSQAKSKYDASKNRPR